MSNLTEILSNQRKIDEKLIIIEPIEREINHLRAKNEDLIYQFLVDTLEKRKKYYLVDEHDMKWFMLCTHDFDSYAKTHGHPQIFHIEHRAKKVKSQHFKDVVNTMELYDLVKNSVFFKELVRESAIENILK
jgi:hypothetical protein